MLKLVEVVKWDNSSEFKPLSDSLFLMLFSNEIAAIKFDNFASPEECIKITGTLKEIGFDTYIDVEPNIQKIGVTQFESRSFDNGKEWYFNSSKLATQKQDNIFQNSFNPIERLINLLKESNFQNVDIPCETGNPYYCGLIRNITDSALIHFDYAKFDAPGWAIEDTKSQLAWNLCLEEPKTDGCCTIYNKQWSLECEEHRIPGSYGFSASLTKDTEYSVIKPKLGQIYFFNSRNFHSVDKCDGNRITISCFIGINNEENKLSLWS